MGASNSQELTDADLEEINRTTNFTRAEVREMYQKFRTDFPDGVITRDSFGKMYAALFPDGDTTTFAKHVFRAYDADGNGEIDFKEFMSTLSIAAKGTLEEKLKWAFNLYDLDGNGSVSRPEATEMIMAIYRMQGMPNPKEKAEEAALQFFLIVDKNKDDSLSQHEFMSAIENSSAVRKLLQGTI